MLRTCLVLRMKRKKSRENNVTGEIVISVEMAARLARRQERAVDGELALYLTHGLLHLLGYNDKKKSGREKNAPKRAGVADRFGL